MPKINLNDIQAASNRIKPYIKPTPILESSLLNNWLGHQILFKAECLQTTGAFKLRGALNMLLKAKEEGNLPQRVVASSSGNHAQAVAYAAKLLGVKATIFSPRNISAVKGAATRYYGAELDLSDTRHEADEKAQHAGQQENTIWLPPFNHPDIISGQGTVMLDTFAQTQDLDGVFAPCGGGGLLSGSLVTTRALSPNTQVCGVEPLAANDAAESLRMGHIQRLSSQPQTLADGAATLAVGDITFPYLKQLDDFYEASEGQIAYWTQWLQHLLKIHVEPTCAMSMAGVVPWLAAQTEAKKVLVILSGGNIDQQKMQQIWQQDHLSQVPDLTLA
ncbi:MAG: threonine dehydratase [Paraglaciecola sp.]|jgi:threonine dehydratase